MSVGDKDNHKGGHKGSGAPAKGEPGQEPDWTEGLKRLYDSVVEEPLPDCFKDLLSRLDDSEK